MELRELRYFRTVVESGSFSKAAVKLMVAQPSLSRQIRALEHDLGMPLLHRNARGVSPTEAGTVLMERTLRLEEDMDGIRRTFTTMAKRSREHCAWPCRRLSRSSSCPNW
jgi:LysR family transcriptional regulator, nitrogen assimilation regulatory protein